MSDSLYNFINFSVKYEDNAINKNKNMDIPVFEYMNKCLFVLSLSIGIIASLSIIRLYRNSGITNDYAEGLEIAIAIVGSFALLSLTRLFFVYSRYGKNKYQ